MSKTGATIKDGEDAARRIALVTGAARRIGRAIALELARDGFDVVIHYRSSRKDAEATAAAIERLGGRALLARADLAKVGQIDRLFDQVAARFGGLDLLVNNASSFYATPFGATRERDFDELIGSNLKAPYFCAQRAAPLLRASPASGGGQIVNVLDAAALRPFPAYLPYSAAKAGLLALTIGLARALAPRVRVNGVAPGPVLLPERFTAERRRQALAATLLKRIGSAEDVARTVAFLASGPDYITGAVIPVDGGRTAA